MKFSVSACLDFPNCAFFLSSPLRESTVERTAETAGKRIKDPGCGEKHRRGGKVLKDTGTDFKIF